MYSNGFVVSIISNHQIARESKAGIVRIGLNSEYTIRLRNKNNRRATAKVYIDDENVTENGIIVDAGSSVELERPVSKAVKFKFVSADSAEAQDFGKDNLPDGASGLIRVDWQLEKEVVHTQYVPVSYPYPVYTPRAPWNQPGPTWTCGVPGPQMSFNSHEQCKGTRTHRGASLGFADTPGVTVDGGYSSQRFTSVNIDVESQITTIRLTLRGIERSKSAPSGNYCYNCGGKFLEVSPKFCSNCGASLLTER